MGQRGLSAALVAIALLVVAPSGASAVVTHTATTVNGISVDRYAWPDSAGRTRTVSLKRQGAGNGGFAVQMTYQTPGGQTVTANVTPGEGFGYFVSHERYRQFVAGDDGTIAGRIFGKDDSPLGRGFPVTGAQLDTGDPDKAAHRFRLTYPRYGTVAAGGVDNNGSDSPKLSLNPSDYKLYQLPVTITWHFESGTDYPAIRTQVGLSGLPGPNRVSFDLRGPYGVLDFDQGAGQLQRVQWGDRLHFTTTTAPLTRNSAWEWNTANNGARYTALSTAAHEMGLFEPRPYSASALVDGYAENRGNTSAARENCGQDTQLLPCDWEWPYQSAQFSLPYDNNDGTTGYEKIAWGSSGYYGMDALNQVYDGEQANPFNGFPSSKEIGYDTCVVLGQTTIAGLTRTAAAGPAYNCALPFAISDPGGGGGGECEAATEALGVAKSDRQTAKRALAGAKRKLKRLSSRDPAKKKVRKARTRVAKTERKLKRATERFRAAKQAVAESCG